MLRTVLELLIDGVIDVLFGTNRARSRVEWVCLPVGLGCLLAAVWVTLVWSQWLGVALAIVGTVCILYWQ